MTTVSKEPGEKLVTLGGTRTMELEAPLTEAERAGLERRIADASAEAFRLEEEKKEAVAPINERLKEVKSRTKELHAQREQGTMKKPVPVRTRADLFRGEKWVERLDGDEPQEVPETRSALTDSERQLMIPGFRVEGGKDDRPNAEVVSLFSSQEGESTATVTWARLLPKPLERWKVERSGAEYQVVDTETWQVFGPFDYVHGKGLVPQFQEETQSKLEEAAGGGLRMAALLAAVADTVREHLTDGPRKAWETTLPAPHEHWTVSEPEPGQYLLTEGGGDDATTPKSWGPYAWQDDAFARVGTLVYSHEAGIPDSDLKELRAHVGDDVAQVLLDAFEDAVRTRRREVADAERHAAVPARGLTLHPVPGIEGWALYMHEGYAYLRPPNVDRFTPPGDAADQGPLEWDPEANRWELADSAPDALEDWVREHASIMKCADSLVRQGKVPLESLRTESREKDEETPPPGERAAGAAADENTDWEARAKKLSDSARMVLKLLAQPDAPTDVTTIGSRCRCKAGSVLNGLESKGFAERFNPDTGIASNTSTCWRITDDGRQVVSALAGLGK